MPQDLTATINNKPVEIKNQLVGSSESGNTRTRYLYPGVRLRLKNNMVLNLKSGDKKASVPIKYRYKAGDIIMSFLFNLPTLEVGFLVDFATGALKTPKQRFIDVPAVFGTGAPRGQKELHSISRGGN